MLEPRESDLVDESGDVGFLLSGLTWRYAAQCLEQSKLRELLDRDPFLLSALDKMPLMLDMWRYLHLVLGLGICWVDRGLLLFCIPNANSRWSSGFAFSRKCLCGGRLEADVFVEMNGLASINFLKELGTFQPRLKPQYWEASRHPSKEHVGD